MIFWISLFDCVNERNARITLRFLIYDFSEIHCNSHMHVENGDFYVLLDGKIG